MSKYYMAQNVIYITLNYLDGMLARVYYLALDGYLPRTHSLHFVVWLLFADDVHLAIVYLPTCCATLLLPKLIHRRSNSK